LRRRLAPTGRFGCKRILLSDDYYPALAQPNVTVTSAAAEVRPAGVVDADGVEHAADVLVFATGFHVHDLPIATRLVGRTGRTLAEVWDGAPVAHVATTVHGFPNLFVVQGPNSGLGHSSVVLTAEAQAEHIAGALREMDARGAVSAEPTAAAQAAFVADVDRMSVGTVWMSGCQSWYLDANGRNAALWPGSVGAFRRRVAPFDAGEYVLRARSGTPVTPPAVSEVPSIPAASRIRGAAARALGLLPAAAVQRLAGPPIVVDGLRLDPHVQLLLRLNEHPDAVAEFRADPVRARRALRRDVLAVQSGRTAVGSVRDLTVGGAAGPRPARLYMPRGADRPPLVVYLHGGGFVEGDLDTHDEPCRILCRQAGHAVLSVDYRLAPEHPFPAAAEDAVAAFRWAQANAERLGADPARVAVGGDSAGGNLAAVVAQATRGDRPPLAQLLIYPATDTPTDRPSRRLFDGYLLPDGLRQAFFDVYTAGSGADAADVRLSPGLAPDLAGLAPALVLTAGFDVLRDEGEAYAAGLTAAGVPVAAFREPGLPHGFLHLTDAVPAAHLATVATARQWRAFVAGLAP
jgi:acetyl esterase